jgi:hypothetical protein
MGQARKFYCCVVVVEEVVVVEVGGVTVNVMTMSAVEEVFEFMMTNDELVGECLLLPKYNTFPIVGS